MRSIYKVSALALSAALFANAALAQTTVLDQQPSPGLTQATTTESLLQSYAVTGGTIYTTTVNQQRYAPGNGQPAGVSSVFVPIAAGGLVRYLPLMLGRTDTGLVLTASSSAGIPAITHTTGSVSVLTLETANSNTKTDKVLWEFNLPDTYVAGASISFVINGTIAGASCTLTGGSTLLTPVLYTEVNGVEAVASGAITAATQWGAAQADYTFVQVGTGLTPGMHVVLELTAAVAASSGNNCVGAINSVKYTS